MSRSTKGKCDHARCARCGYDLFGLPHDICPECGERVDANLLLEGPTKDTAAAGACCSVIGAFLAAWSFTSMSLDSIAERGRRHSTCGTHMHDDSFTDSMCVLSLVMLVGGVWFACRHRTFRRLALNALLATIAALITCLVMLGVR